MTDEHIQRDLEDLISQGHLTGQLSRAENKTLLDEKKISQFTYEKLEADVTKYEEMEGKY